MEKIRRYYKERTENELDLNIKVNLTGDQERYIKQIASNFILHDETDEIIYKLARIVYMNLLECEKVGA